MIGVRKEVGIKRENESGLESPRKKKWEKEVSENISRPGMYNVEYNGWSSKTHPCLQITGEK